MLRMDWKAILPGKMENPDGLSQITDMEEWPRDSECSTYETAKLDYCSVMWLKTVPSGGLH